MTTLPLNIQVSLLKPKWFKPTFINTQISALNMLHVETEDNFYAPVRITIVDFDRNMVYGKILYYKQGFPRDK